MRKQPNIYKIFENIDLSFELYFEVIAAMEDLLDERIAKLNAISEEKTKGIAESNDSEWTEFEMLGFGKLSTINYELPEDDQISFLESTMRDFFYKSLVISVYSYWERYFNQILDRHIQLFPDSKPAEDISRWGNKRKLEKILNVTEYFYKTAQWKNFEVFRTIRNTIVHKSSKIDSKNTSIRLKNQIKYSNGLKLEGDFFYFSDKEYVLQSISSCKEFFDLLRKDFQFFQKIQDN
ncbi:hypothetical protein [Aquiflexum lacus]|uniref:hypothetical protein n=1 Tax=Aquiflexum lacus TaxID=2483805 RepID=UPI0018946DF8|nr:hypothetical protein [Aquiflexum lacus]